MWKKEELKTIFEDENLYISIPNADGSMHKPTWIWIAPGSDGKVYTRAYNGVSSRWYKAAKAAGHGHIKVGDLEKDVKFDFPSDEETFTIIDNGYTAKYGAKYSGSWLDPMLEPTPRSASVSLIPIE